MKRHVLIKRVIVISISICTIILIAASTLNCIYGGQIKDNRLTYKVDNSLLIVHIRFEAGSKDKPVSYKVINPNNKIVSQGTAEGIVDYLGQGGKGTWTVEFDQNQPQEMKNVLWSGNWTFYDTADKNM